MTDMRVEIAGVELKNPVITASGTFGFAEEYAPYMELSGIGAVGLKALTRGERQGNPPVRIAVSYTHLGRASEETCNHCCNSISRQGPVQARIFNEIFADHGAVRCDVADMLHKSHDRNRRDNAD